MERDSAKKTGEMCKIIAGSFFEASILGKSGYGSMLLSSSYTPGNKEVAKIDMAVARSRMVCPTMMGTGLRFL